jgi:hypothetical protein
MVPSAAAPDLDALCDGFLGARIDLRLGEGAQRVLDHNQGKIVHAQRIALDLRLVQKLGRDDDGRRAAQRLEFNSIVRTARCA